MFTGIIEKVGKIIDIEKEEENIHFSIESSISNKLKIDQSIAHNGICLTVVDQKKDYHLVTAIKETLMKSNANDWEIGDEINLERCLKFNGRIDGHLVQGHVDTVGIISNIENENGSFLISIRYENSDYITVEKGSITINGISLTVVNSKENAFSVAIIPYTWENTNFKNYTIGDKVNLEFDILGKYISKLIAK